jgi:hypothetical protein
VVLTSPPFSNAIQPSGNYGMYYDSKYVRYITEFKLKCGPITLKLAKIFVVAVIVPPNEAYRHLWSRMAHVLPRRGFEKF